MKKKITASISSLSLDTFYNIDVLSFAENLYISNDNEEKIFPFEDIKEELNWEELLQEEYIN